MVTLRMRILFLPPHGTENRLENWPPRVLPPRVACARDPCLTADQFRYCRRMNARSDQERATAVLWSLNALHGSVQELSALDRQAQHAEATLVAAAHGVWWVCALDERYGGFEPTGLPRLWLTPGVGGSQAACAAE